MIPCGFRKQILPALLAGCSIVCPVHAGALPETPPDSTAYPDKMPERQMWEKIVMSPVWAATLPLKLLSEGTGELVGLLSKPLDDSPLRNLFISEDKRRVLLPAYSSLMGAGLQFYLKGLGNERSKMSLSFMQGFHGRWGAKFEMKRFRLSDRMTWGLMGAHMFQSDEDFFEIGPDSEESDRTNYAHRYWTFEGHVAAHLNTALALRIVEGVDINDIFNGRSDDYPSSLSVSRPLAGAGEQVIMSRTQVELEIDSRDHEFHPVRGGNGVAGVGLFRQTNGSRFGFLKGYFDYRRYLHIAYERVLILRAAVEVNRHLTSAGIPFYYLSELGYRSTVRGFDRWRFRDDDKLILTAEYRWPIWRRIDGVLFLDSGRVAGDLFRDLGHGNFQATWGGGCRVWTNDLLVLKVEIGKSRDGVRYHVTMFNE